ncbi:MAG: hypothetical protein Q8K82_09500 [Gemmatimonadaceae bacterium]|nr:hypothetical protein [Gemmatimonadaceae bacterium]
MTDDERFNQFLRENSADYESPRGDVPRDEMWAAIQTQRGTGAAVPMFQRTAARRWAYVGMAATLLLGVGIGRYAYRSQPEAPAVVAATQLPTSPADAPQAQPVDEPASVVPSSPSAPANGASPVASNGAAAAANGAYTIASDRHLQAVQVLLTSFSTDNADTRSDSIVATWARGLLSNTRLLLDSPAARDPQRARLLQDLEVVLVQLVQRSPGAAAADRSDVERTLEKNQIIPRLRSALPAGLPSGTD